MGNSRGPPIGCVGSPPMRPAGVETSRVVSTCPPRDEKLRTSSLFTSTTLAPAGNVPACSRVLDTLSSEPSWGFSPFELEDALPSCGIVRAAPHATAHRSATRAHLVTVQSATDLPAIVKARPAAVIEFCNRIHKTTGSSVTSTTPLPVCHHRGSLTRTIAGAGGVLFLQFTSLRDQTASPVQNRIVTMAPPGRKIWSRFPTLSVRPSMPGTWNRTENPRGHASRSATRRRARSP